MASTRTASYSPKIKVDVIGSKPNGSPKGLGRSPTIVFPGAVKTFTPSVFDAVMLAGLLTLFCLPSIRALTVLKGGALADLNNVAVRIADVAARLAVFGDGLREELGSP